MSRRTRTAAAPLEPPAAPATNGNHDAHKVKGGDDPMALVEHRVCQIKKRGAHFGILAQVGEIEGDEWVWLYRWEGNAVKTFYRVRPTELIVIGKPRVCSHTPKPDSAQRRAVEEAENEEIEN